MDSARSVTYHVNTSRPKTGSKRRADTPDGPRATANGHSAHAARQQRPRLKDRVGVPNAAICRRFEKGDITRAQLWHETISCITATSCSSNDAWACLMEMKAAKAPVGLDVVKAYLRRFGKYHLTGDRASELVRLLDDAGCPADTELFNGFVLCFATLDEPNEVKHWIEQMKLRACEPTAQTFTPMIQAKLKEKNLKGARLWLEKMDEAQVEPTDATFGILVSGCADAGDLAWADELLARMALARKSPNPGTLAKLVKACVKVNKVDDAARHLDAMIEAAKTNPRFQPHPSVISDVLLACARKGRADVATKYFELLRDRERQGLATVMAWNFTCAIAACERGGDFESADRYRADWQQARAAQPGNAALVPARKDFDILLQGAAHGPQPARSFDWLETARLAGIEPDTKMQNMRIVAASRSNNPALAIQVFREIKQKDPGTYFAFIDACRDDPDMCVDILRQGIVDGFFNKELGLDAATGKLDFHTRSVLTRSTRQWVASHWSGGGVTAVMARAIFDAHVMHPEDHGAIDNVTEFIVGQYGNGIVRDAVAGCMARQGMSPVSPEGNPGVLIDQAGHRAT
ncbi:MAG TPA: hypothetical protein VL593_06195 [Ramlibacter sp.]|nr:hypothetical protein [Ramlibacter sp.]